LFRSSLEEREKRLANIAVKIFCEKGYQIASLADIASKAKISTTGIFHYFKTKEDILFFLDGIF